MRSRMSGRLTIEEINDLLASGLNQSEVARRAGVSRQAMSLAVRRREAGHTMTYKQEQMVNRIKYETIRNRIIERDVSVATYLKDIGQSPTKAVTAYKALQGETNPSLELITQLLNDIKLPFEEVFKEALE